MSLVHAELVCNAHENRQSLVINVWRTTQPSHTEAEENTIRKQSTQHDKTLLSRSDQNADAVNKREVQGSFHTIAASRVAPHVQTPMMDYT